MSFASIPAAPMPPRPRSVYLGPYHAHDLQHQLLFQAQKLRSRSVPVAPHPPAPVSLKRGVLPSNWNLKWELEQARFRLKPRRTSPIAPPPPAPMSLKRGVLPSNWDLKWELGQSRLLLRGRRSPLAPPAPAPARVAVPSAYPLSLQQQLKPAALLLKPARIPLAPTPPPAMRLRSWSAPELALREMLEKATLDRQTRQKGLPRPVQKEALRAAEDMRKALAEHNPPLAPAAPAPVLSAAAPLHQPIGEEAARAAKEMTLAHYPPLAPANPAPDMIAKDAVLKKPLQEKLLPAAIHAMQNVDHPPLGMPAAPPAPSAYRLRRGFLDAPLGYQLKSAAKQRKLAKRAKLDFVPAARSIEPVHAVVPPVVTAPVVAPAPALPPRPVMAPPLPPRPVETLVAMGLRGNAVVHDKERVIQHEPILEKEIINERPVEVKHEHHIQPIVHEVEHRIQPIIKTEATTATTYIEKDKNVMLPPIVEAPVMMTAPVAAAPIVSTAAPVMATSMPIASQTRAMPIAAAPMMPMRSSLGSAGQGMLDSEERMGLGVVAPIMPGEKEILLEGIGKRTHHKHGAGSTLSPNTVSRSGAGTHTSALSPKSSSASRGRRGSIGMKIKGAMKEVQGAITRNPAKKEEGKMLLHGVDPASSSSASRI